MRNYLDLLSKILEHGTLSKGRTGTGTLALFGEQLRFDLAEGFPLVTTKQVHLKSIIHELLWFVNGDTNVKYLQANGVTIWDEWADENGDLGPVYGAQWRNFGGVDQLGMAVRMIRETPESRRILVSAWNPPEVPSMALPPCHLLYQFNVRGTRLDCSMYQRSVDTFLGLPFNIASYALLTLMVARVTGLQPGHLIMSLGDTHLYLNHQDQAREQISRKPHTIPGMIVEQRAELEEFVYEDFDLWSYDYHPSIKAPISV